MMARNLTDVGGGWFLYDSAELAGAALELADTHSDHPNRWFGRDDWGAGPGPATAEVLIAIRNTLDGLLEAEVLHTYAYQLLCDLQGRRFVSLEEIVACLREITSLLPWHYTSRKLPVLSPDDRYRFLIGDWQHPGALLN